MSTLTQLIRQIGQGDAGARDALFAAAYDQLRKLARSRLRDGRRNTVLERTPVVEVQLARVQETQVGLVHQRGGLMTALKV